MATQSTKKPKMEAAAAQLDAIALLKADHRQVEELFDAYSKSRSPARKGTLALEICAALRIHMAIEEEFFYPAFLEGTSDSDLHHEAEVEHAGARKLMTEIEASSPDDEYFDAKIKVLSELIKHHVKEEEQRGGMFAKAKDSEMDLEELGIIMSARKEELSSSPGQVNGERKSASRAAAAH